MTTGTAEAPGRTRRDATGAWVLRVALVVVTALPLGLFALIDVIDGNGGEAGHTPFMDAVLDEEPPMVLVFLLLPILLGVAASWAARRGGLRLATSLVTGPVTVAGYLGLLVVLGTGLGPFDVLP